MSLKIIEQGQLIHAPLSVIWECLFNVAKWGLWNPTIRSVELLETPKLDARGKIFPVSESPYPFRFTRITPESALHWERPYRLGTKLVQCCTFIRNAEGAVVTLELWCEGVFEKQVGFMTRRRLSNDLLHQSLSLKTLCEKRHSELEQIKKMTA